MKKKREKKIGSEKIKEDDREISNKVQSNDMRMANNNGVLTSCLGIFPEAQAHSNVTLS
jgi:hypothetical protein